MGIKTEKNPKGAGRKVSDKSKRACFYVCCKPAEKERIKELAKSSGLSVSEFIFKKCFE